MDKKRTYRIDKKRLQEYNDMKPAAKKILGLTARLAMGMMKTIVRVAWAIPGIVKKMADRSHSDQKRADQDSTQK